MKKDMDTVSVELEHELLYLQVARGYQEEARRWHAWHEKLHEHVVYEMDVVTRGSCNINVEGKRCLLRAGQAMVIPPRRHHGCHAEKGEFEYFSFFFLPDESAETLNAALRDRVPGLCVFPATEPMLEIVRCILQEWTDAQPYRREKCQTLLTELAIDTIRQLQLARPPQAGVDKEPSRMFLCDRYFSGGAQDRSAEELAGLLRVSKRQMNRCLQEYYGMSFREKLVHTRMECAAWLLRTSERSVEEIVPIVGYGSESGFFKAFRHRYGMTPLEYRARYQVRRRPPAKLSAALKSHTRYRIKQA